MIFLLIKFALYNMEISHVLRYCESESHVIFP